MDLQKKNIVLSLLIEEIKNKEKQSNNLKPPPKIKGKDFARSLLKNDGDCYNINKPRKKGVLPFDLRREKYKNELEEPTNRTNEKELFDNKEKPYNRKEKNDTENEKREDVNEIDNSNEQDDSLSETEKQALHFYDPLIDEYDEEYVTRKYRFMDTTCNSSLCCCGCFNPVCYKSERHSTYINQYKSLYAVGVVMEKENILSAKEIHMKKVTMCGETNSEEDTSSIEQSETENKETDEESEIEEEINKESKTQEKINGECVKEEEEGEEAKAEVEEAKDKIKVDVERGTKKATRTHENTAIKISNQLKRKMKKKARSKYKKGKRKNFTYYPVFCANCDNHLAYYEIETKLFYFFDVLPD